MIKKKELLDRQKAMSLIENLEFSELMIYIEERLRGKTILPAIDTKSDETLEYFLEKLYEHSNSDEFKMKFRKAVATLLSRELMDISQPDYIAILLALCEEFIIEEAIAPVSGLALSGNLKGINSIYDDLHRQTLMALARMTKGLKMTDIWVDSISDLPYTAASFAALREQGLETICKYLPRYIQMVNDQPDSLDLDFAIKTLYDSFQSEYSEEEITKLILDCMENENENIMKELIRILESIDKEGLLSEAHKGHLSNREIKVFIQLKNYLFRELTGKEVAPEKSQKEIGLWQWVAEKENKPKRSARWKELTQSAA